ncbi:MAG TPA: glycerate kinase [Chthoniobacteraceae bacterium]
MRQDINLNLRRDAKTIFRAALEAAHAGNAVRAHLSLRGGVLKAGNYRFPLQAFDRVFLIAIGKAAIEMAAAVETIVGSRLTAGLAITKHGHAQIPLRKIPILEAGHPIPDAAGINAAHQVRELLRELNARDLLIVTVSGGASALLSAPTEPITLSAKQKTTDLLLRAGADIFQLNAVRKHLSFLKGGRLAALAYPATVVSLLLSDVIGDPLDVIGSGPTAPDSTTFAHAIHVLKKFKIVARIPKAVLDLLQRGARREIPETPKPGDPLFANVYNIVAGSNALALKAAARQARALGYRPRIVSSVVSGEAREVAVAHAAILRGAPRPACLLAGGETTVTVKGKGKGGRNQEFALAAAIEMDGLPGILALCAGTDGTDGPTDAAGAIATGKSIARAARLGLDPAKYLANNDSYTFFEAVGDLVKTGPTGTNVMDIEVLLAG